MNQLTEVKIPQDFSRYIKELEIQNVREFLLKMCEDSKSRPIIDGEDSIGIITYSVINSLNNGIVSYGKLFKKVSPEFMLNDDKSLTILSLNISDIYGEDKYEL